ncbi:MAG TPA: VOC family protein [Myxococcota bacterium]|nr:VOC family protein [Myxococcota bacterium]
MPRVRLLDVVVPCLEYRLTRHFYQAVLGLEVASEGTNHVFFYTGGTSKVALVDAAEGDRLVRPSGHGIYLDLVAQDLTYIRRQLSRHQVSIVDERSDEHGKAVTVRDPEGNLLNIFQEGTVD